MKPLLFCAAALWTTTVAASAADLSRAAPSFAPAGYNWGGFYLGGNGGYAWGRSDTSNNTATTDRTLFGAPIGAFAFETFRGPDRNRTNSGGFGGVTAGINFQSGNVVLGMEADFQGADITNSDSFTTGGVTYSSSDRIDWFGTVRGRFGMAFDSFLPYVTGGFAYAHAKSDLSVAFGNSFQASSLSGTMTGWTVGAGVEWALAGNWTAKVEYLYIDLGTENATLAFPSANGSVVRSDINVDLNLVRAGLNYRF